VKPIKNILVPVDLSTVSEPALKISKTFSQKMNAHLHIFTVISELIVNNFRRYSNLGSDDVMKSAEEKLKTLIDGCGLEQTNHSYEIVPGVSFIEILEKSSKIPADLIMMGSLGAYGLDKLDSNTFKLIRMAPVHTFAFTIEGRETAPDIPINRILVALDFSEHSLIALEYALYLKPIFDAEIHLFQVVSKNEESREEVMKEKLQQHLSSEKMDEIDNMEVIASDSPAHEILNKISESNIDLLAIGSHSRRRLLRNLFLGKVSYDVVRRANCPLLVVKNPD
jgi:nucleotide-binding universal stress UspA family protein